MGTLLTFRTFEAEEEEEEVPEKGVILPEVSHSNRRL